MKKYLYILLLVLFTSCHQPVNTVDLQQVDFEQVLDSDTIKLNIYNLYATNPEKNTITIIPAEEIKVEAKVNQALIDANFEIKYEEQELIIKSDKQRFFSNFYVDLTIYAPIDQLKIKGAFEIVYNNPVGEKLSVDIEGAANLQMENITQQQVEVHLEGAGKFTLAGETDDFYGSIEGAGAIDAFGLLAKVGNLQIDGAGQISAHVSQQLQATINGLGSIQYKGKPSLQQEINGLGTIQPIE